MKTYDGYDLEQVAKEMAQIYGGYLTSWEVQGDKLVVEFNECGEDGITELPLNEIKEFMEM